MAIRLNDYSNAAIRVEGQVRKMEGSESFQVGQYNNQVQRFTVTAVDDNALSVSFIDTAGNIYNFSYTGVATDTAADNRDGLLAVIQADASFAAIATAAANGVANIDITTSIAGSSITVGGLVGAGTLLQITAPITGAPIPAGRAVVRSATDDQVIALPNAGSAAGDLLGIVIRKHAYSTAGNNNAVSVPVGSHGEVMYRGEIYVEVDQDVTAGGNVFIRVDGGVLGIARADVDGGDAVQLPGAVFIQSGAAGDIVAIRVNKP